MSTTPDGNPRSLERLVRRRRIRRSFRAHAAPRPQKPDLRRTKYVTTESEFVAWLRELASDPKWKNPTPWDEHTFRVGVMNELLRHVQSPNAQPLSHGDGSQKKATTP